jgi:hypothetical protein
MWLPTASSVGRGLPAASPVAQGTGGAVMSSTLLLLLGTSLSAASLSPRRAQESPFIISLHRALPPTLPGTKKVDLVYGFDLMKRLVLLGFVSATTAPFCFRWASFVPSAYYTNAFSSGAHTAHLAQSVVLRAQGPQYLPCVCAGETLWGVAGSDTSVSISARFLQMSL